MPLDGKAMRATDIRRDATETLAWRFPHYTAAEAATDRALHFLALPAAIVAVGWLFLAAIPTADIEHTVAGVIYGCGLIGMLTASAAYNLSRPSRRKELLRRVDHAMIFVMIAGTYTPFALFAFRDMAGPLLCLLVWSLAAIGVSMTLAFPRRFERLLLVLYLIMGWMVIDMGRSFLTQLPGRVLTLLLAGGAAYTVGTIVHARCRFAFQNVVWHALVVSGASLHWMAVTLLLAAPISSLATLSR